MQGLDFEYLYTYIDPMKAEIERLINCDESASAMVEKAKKQAEELVASAREEIDAARGKSDQSIEEFRRAGIRNILEEADRKAVRKGRDVDEYCSRIRQLFEDRREGLGERIMRLFYGMLDMDTERE